jgi:hypothetical protein
MSVYSSDDGIFPSGIFPLSPDSKYSDVNGGLSSTFSPLMFAEIWKGWPPAYLGTLPSTHEGPIDYPNLVRIQEGSFHFSNCDRLRADYKTMKCPLIECWSAQLTVLADVKCLSLPTWTKRNDRIYLSKWKYQSNDKYPSNNIFIRDCYVEIADSILSYVASNPEELMQQMIVSGTPGTGKSFFIKYFIWRLLHPDGKYLNKRGSQI